MAKSKKQESGFSDELKKALATLNDSYGAGTVLGMDESEDVTMELMPTGSLVLDLAIKGYPKGKIIEIAGEEGLGKSTLALKFLAQFGNRPTLYIDSESSLDREYAKRLGVDTSSMIVSRPETIEQGITILLDLIGLVDGAVFDSVAEFPTQKEVEGNILDQDIGVKARVMSKAIRKLKAIEHTATVMFINQMRDSPGNIYVPRVSPGGRALRYGCHLRLDVYGKELIRKGSGENAEIIGHRLNVKILKNKNGPPHGKLQIPLIYDSYGISREQEIIDLCLEAGYIIQSGSWFSTDDGTRLGQGVDNVRLFLMDNPELSKELENKLKQI